MTSCVGRVIEAYKAFGLTPEAGLDAAKRAFRDQVKNLHPDVTPATPETLSKLAEIVAAMRFLEEQVPTCMEVEISALQAKTGITRTLRAGGKQVLVRIPARTKNGAMVSAVGEADIAVRVRVLKAELDLFEPADPLDFAPLNDFIDEFSRPSPNARFARWIKKAQSAA